LDCPIDDHALIAPTEWIKASYADIGFEFEYPSNWTVYDSGDFLSVTRNDRIAEVSFGWFPRLNRETNAAWIGRLTANTASNYSGVEYVTIPHEGGDPVEVVLTGVDSEGVRWVHDFVVSGEKPKVFVVETMAQVEILDEAKPVFEAVIASLKVIDG